MYLNNGTGGVRRFAIAFYPFLLFDNRPEYSGQIAGPLVPR